MDQNDQIDSPPPAAGPVTISGRESVAATRARNIMPSFLAELTRVMQAAAERERERIDEVIAEEAAEHVEKTRTRAASETEELRRLAELDVERIQDWSATEIERIRGEADRRTHERRADLEAYLAQHDTIIATEIDEVDAAIRGYRATLDQFFNELSGSTDPSDIARRAGSLPATPDLEGARAAARANAVARALNAPQVAKDEPVGDELGWGGDSGAGPSVETEPGDEPLAESGVGLGVMDPDAAGRSMGLSGVLDEIDAEAAMESASAPPADPLYVGGDVAAEIDSPEPVETSSPAVRLLRSIAPWTTPVVPGPENHDSKDK
jgi:F0F1-type ATP synthase membrane subunit b/b'